MFCCPNCFPTRRKVLAGGAAMVASRPRLTAAAVRPPVREVWIDAHCHVFNAIDLPMAEFILRTRDSFPTRALSGLLEIIVAGLKAQSPTARSEVATLSNGPVRGYSVEPGDKLSTLEALKILRDGPNPEVVTQLPTSGLARLTPPAEGKQLLLEEIQKRFPDRRPFNGSVSDNELTTIAAEQDGRIEGFKTGGPVQLAQWVQGFSSARNEIVRRLVAHYPETSSLMLTPAFVDYSRWLGIGPDSGREPTSLSDQIEVAGALTRAWAKGQRDSNGSLRRVLVSSFAPFDPARCLLPGKLDGDPIETLEAALIKGAVIGAKMYPPMGFRAINNTPLDRAQFPEPIRSSTQNPGPEIDRILYRFYDMCIKLDSPLMAHCGNSNYTDPEYGKRADPEYWLSLISQPKYRNLRVNLGHFGGIWSFGDLDNKDLKVAAKGKEARSWATAIAKSIHSNPDRYPNLYVDVGYASTFLSHDAQDPALEGTVIFLRELLSDYPVMRGRILYGSDWQMVGMEEYQDEYSTLVAKDFLQVVEEAGIDDFRHGNASRFLGIGKGQRTYNRLAQFLGKDAPLLDTFAALNT